MKIGNIEVTGQLILAPMAGVTDYAYRTICASLGANVTVSEMVSSRALVYQDKKSARLLRVNEGSVFGAQIFGNDPELMAQAAVLAMGHCACDFIDINMGCPVPKIVNNGDGSALMKNIDLASKIVEHVVKAVPIPVTVKTRKGWDKGSINVVPFATAMEKAGAAAIGIHGRTKTMMYSGVADWDIIADVKKAVSIPVIANGDIDSGEAILRCKNRTNADFFMIGRAVFGNPWIFSQCQAALDGKEIPPLPPLSQRVDRAVEQIELAQQDKGDVIACLEARKHFAWYLRGVSHASYYKEKICKIAEMKDVYEIAAGIKRDLR